MAVIVNLDELTSKTIKEFDKLSMHTQNEQDFVPGEFNMAKRLSDH
jgi:hypothetical protein